MPGRSSTSSGSKTVAGSVLHVHSQLVHDQQLRVFAAFCGTDFNNDTIHGNPLSKYGVRVYPLPDGKGCFFGHTTSFIDAVPKPNATHASRHTRVAMFVFGTTATARVLGKIACLADLGEGPGLTVATNTEGFGPPLGTIERMLGHVDHQTRASPARL